MDEVTKPGGTHTFTLDKYEHKPQTYKCLCYKITDKTIWLVDIDRNITQEFDKEMLTGDNMNEVYVGCQMNITI